VVTTARAVAISRLVQGRPKGAVQPFSVGDHSEKSQHCWG
jgi:hypothetical protein